jgi:hypothetical protein
MPGVNLDADGRMYLAWQGDGTYIVYKDAAQTMEVGRGKDGGIMTSSNNSGVVAAYVQVNATKDATSGDQNTKLGDVSVLQFGQQFEMWAARSADAAKNGMNTAQMAALNSEFGLDLDDGKSCLSGIRLQQNTSEDARMFFAVDYTPADPSGTPPATATVKVYTDGTMLPEYLVGEGTATITGTGSPATNDAFQVTITPANDSGLFGSLAFGDGGIKNMDEASNATGSLEFNNLGLRVYSDQYGSSQYIRAQTLEGNLLGTYAAADSYDLVPVREGESKQANGGDALGR